MSFIGTVGVVAQQGNNASVSLPTGVSIAEAASSGQNNAFKATDVAPDIMTVDYSDWSGSTSESFGTQYEREVSAGDLGDFDDYGVIRITPFAYLRATGATSFSWTNSVYSHNFLSGSASPSATVGGNSNNSQDATGSSGMGIYFQINPGSGRGGNNIWPSDGHYVIFKLIGSATNSGGSTDAELFLKYTFTE